MKNSTNAGSSAGLSAPVDLIRLTLIRPSGKDAGIYPRKIYRHDGIGFVMIQSYPKVTHWTRQQVTLEPDIDALHAMLSALPDDCCVVTGIPSGVVADDAPAKRRKLDRDDEKATLAETSSSFHVVDIDNLPIPDPLSQDTLLDAIEYARAQAGLGDISIAWHLTNSATTQIGKPLLSLRLWCVTDREISNAERKQWATALNKQAGFKLADPAVYSAAQPIYVAKPDLQGHTDPWPTRWGVLYGEQDVYTWPTADQVQPEITYTGRYANVRGFADMVARIGDGEGQHGVHDSVLAAVCYGTRRGMTIDAMHAAISRQVLATDTSKHDQAYVLRETSKREIARIAAWASATNKGRELPLRRTTTTPLPIPLHEAEQRVAGVVRAWMDNPKPTVLAVTVGSGKTYQAVAAAVEKLNANPDLKIIWLAPTHNQAIEVEQQFNDALEGSAIRIRGRDQVDSPDDEPLCQRTALIQLVRDKGLAAHTMRLCCEHREEGKIISQCPYRADCAYFQQFDQSVRVRILPHELLTKPQSRALSDKWAKSASLVIVDESPLSVLLHHHRQTIDAIEQDVGGIIAGAARMIFDGAVIEDAEALADAVDADGARCQQVAPDFEPGQSTVHLLERYAELKANPAAKFAPLARCLASYLRGAHNTVWRGRDGYLHFAWRNNPALLQSALILDATADSEIYQAIMPDCEIHRIEVEQNLHLTQVNDTALSKRRIESDEELPHRIAALARLSGNVAVIANKALRETIEPMLPDGIPTGHFNALRGLNALKTADTLIIAGRPEPDALSAEAAARALWPDAALNLTGKFEWQRCEFTGAGVSGHQDDKVDAVLRSIRESEIAQAIGRLRAVRSETMKQVILLSTAPAPRQPDAVVELDDVLPSYRWARVINDSNGVVITNPTHLSGTLPDVFATPNEAEKWLSRERLKPPVFLMSSIHISETGDLKPIQYRLSGQKGKLAKALTWMTDEPTLKHAIEQATGRTVTALQVTQDKQMQQAAPKWEVPSFEVKRVPVDINMDEVNVIRDYDWELKRAAIFVCRVIPPDAQAIRFAFMSSPGGLRSLAAGHVTLHETAGERARRAA